MKPGPRVRLDWLMLLPLDVTLSLAILVVCATLCASYTQILQDKARLASALSNSSSEQRTAIEVFSVEGAFAAPSPGSTSPLSGNYELSYRQSGGRIDVAGALREGGPVLQFSLAPAIKAVDGGWSVMWLCSQKKAPAGWIAASAGRLENLKPAELPFACRASKVE